MRTLSLCGPFSKLAKCCMPASWIKVSPPWWKSFKVCLSLLDRVFVSCEQVKALVSVGCCYNLLSEDSYEDTNTCPGFPMSKAAKLSELVLGKSIRDLACQVWCNSWSYCGLLFFWNISCCKLHSKALSVDNIYWQELFGQWTKKLRSNAHKLIEALYFLCAHLCGLQFGLKHYLPN